MWRSLGDKYDIVPHNNKERPRQFKSNVIIIIILVILYLSGSLIFIHIRPEASFYYYIPSVLGCLAFVTGSVLLFLKWKRNNKELDISLLIATIIFAAYAYATFSF